MRSFLNIHGVEVELSAPPEFAAGQELLRNILEDFSYFQSDASNLKLHLKFRLEPRGDEPAGLIPAFKTGMCRAMGWGNRRVCDYGFGTSVDSWFENDRRCFVIRVGEPETAYEALYSAMLSAIGEELDRRGYHRVHGLALENAGKRVLVLLPSGAGKSAIAALLTRETNTRIYSDESPLIANNKIWPFPIRGALRPSVAKALGLPTEGRRFKRKLYPEKLLFGFDRAKVAEPGSLDWILVGARVKSGQSPEVRVPKDPIQAKAAAFFEFVQSGVVGLGLAQMSEYMIRADSLWKLPRIGTQRLAAFTGLLAKTRVGFFDVIDDARQNARALEKFLSE